MPNPELLNESYDVLLVGHDLEEGGIQRVMSNLANGWCRRGYRIAVLTYSSEKDEYSLDERVSWFSLGHPGSSDDQGVRAPKWTLRRYLSWKLSPMLYALSMDREYTWRMLGRILSEYTTISRLRAKLATINTRCVVSFMGTINLHTIVACRKLDRRVIISERNDPAVQKLGVPWEVARKKYYRQADLVTANSQGALKTLESYVERSKLAFVPNPLTPVPEVAPYHVGAPYFVVVARLHPQKAHDILLSAFARVTRVLPAWRLVVVGKGELEKSLKEQAQELGIQKQVDWRGHVANPFPYYLGASVFVLPSRHEGMPNALMEALSCGLPSIITNASPGPLELVTHEKNGLVVPPDDATALANAMVRLAKEDELRKQMGLLARQSVSGYAETAALATWGKVIGLPSYQETPSLHVC